MNESEVSAAVGRAMGIAQEAWSRAYKGLPSGPMTRTADVVAVAAVAASLLGAVHLEDEQLIEDARKAILVARRTAERMVDLPPGNPMARSAERASIGIVAAAILNSLHGRRESGG